MVSSNQSFWCSGRASMTPQRRMWLNISSRAWANATASESRWDFFLLMHLPFGVETPCGRGLHRTGIYPVAPFGANPRFSPAEALMIMFIGIIDMNLTEGAAAPRGSHG